MRALKCFLLLVCSLWLGQVYAEDREANVTKEFIRTYHYIASQPERIWPNMDVSKYAHLFYFYDLKHTRALNFSPLNSEWIKQTIDDTATFYLDHDAYDLDKGTMCNLFPADWQCMSVGGHAIDEQQSIVLSLRASDTLSLPFIMSFYVGYIAETTNPFFEYPYPWLMPDVKTFNEVNAIKLAYLESKLLLQYLSNQHDRFLLRQAVAIHQYRNHFLSKDDIEYENKQGIYEGYVGYIGLQSQNLAEGYYDQELKDRLQTYLTPFDYDNTKGVLLSAFIATNNMIYSHALDQLYQHGSWKLSAEKEKLSATNMAMAYYNFSEAESTAIANDAMLAPEYGYKAISDDVDENIAPKIKAMQEAVSAYQQDPGIEVQLTNLFDQFYMHNEHPDFTPSFKQELFLKAYGELITQGRKINIEFSALPYLFQMHVGDTHAAKFKLPAETIITIDNNTYTLAEFVQAGKSAKTKQFALKTKTIKLAFNDDITVTSNNGTLTIHYDIDFNSLAHKKPQQMTVVKTPAGIKRIVR